MGPRNEESTSLITVRYDSLGEASDSENHSRNFLCFPGWFVKEFRNVFNLAWSLFLLSLFSYVMEPIALFFCGRLGENELAAMALTTSLMNITGVAVGAGLSTACDTVFAQSLGSSNKTEAGVYLIKSSIIILLFSLPCASLHLNLESFLLLIGQPDCVARLSGDYMQYFTICIPAIFLEAILMQYLRCQDYLAVPLLIGGGSVLVCIVLHYILVTVLEYGLIGSAIALVLTYYLMALVLVMYIVGTGLYKPSWRGWTKDIFQGWSPFLKLAIAGFFMVAVEWWIWEFSVVTSGWFGVVELGAASIALQVISIDFMVPQGIGLAVNVRIGQCLGSKQDILAKRMIYIGAVMIVIQAIVINGTVVLLRYEIPALFTDDQAVIDLCAQILPIGCLIALLDGPCGLLNGVLRGCGKQVAGSMIMVFGLTAIGLPVALALQFEAGVGMNGFYYGLMLGVFAEFVLLTLVTWRIKWNKMVHDAQVRAGVYKNSVKSYDTFSIEEGEKQKTNLSFSRLNLKFDPLPEDLSGGQLLLRRTMFILVFVVIFAVGLYFRLTMQSEMYFQDPCLPSGHMANTTMDPLVL